MTNCALCKKNVVALICAQLVITAATSKAEREEVRKYATCLTIYLSRYLFVRRVKTAQARRIRIGTCSFCDLFNFLSLTECCCFSLNVFCWLLSFLAFFLLPQCDEIHKILLVCRVTESRLFTTSSFQNCTACYRCVSLVLLLYQLLVSTSLILGARLFILLHCLAIN